MTDYAESMVAAAWKRGEHAQSRSISTDGRTLYSGGVPVGVTVGEKRYAIPFHVPPATLTPLVGVHARIAEANADQVAPLSVALIMKTAFALWNHRDSNPLVGLAKNLIENKHGWAWLENGWKPSS